MKTSSQFCTRRSSRIQNKKLSSILLQNLLNLLNNTTRCCESNNSNTLSLSWAVISCNEICCALASGSVSGFLRTVFVIHHSIHFKNERSIATKKSQNEVSWRFIRLDRLGNPPLVVFIDSNSSSFLAISSFTSSKHCCNNISNSVRDLNNLALLSATRSDFALSASRARFSFVTASL